MIISVHMTKTLTALKARQNLGQILEEVYYRDGQYIIERAGKPMAAVVPLWQLQKREEGRDRLFKMMDQVHKRNAGVDPAVIEREVAEAVRAVRANQPLKRKRTANSTKRIASVIGVKSR